MINPPQLSVVGGVSNVTTAEHNSGSAFVVIFPGHTITGGSLSITTTSKMHALEFPEASVAT
jgi:hypothetical protein